MKRNVSSPTQCVCKAWLRTVVVLGVATATVSPTPVSSQQTLSRDEVRIRSKPYQPKSQVLRTEAHLVEIEAVVRDDKGRIVGGLKQEDFAVFDDGKKQTISTFQVETHTLVGMEGMKGSSAESTVPAPEVVTARPRYVALYFDDLHTKWGDMKHAQAAAQNFILHGLDPQDRVAVATSSSTVTLDFTSDASKMLDAINRLQSHIRVFDSLGCPRITAHDAYLIVNFPTGVGLSSGTTVNPGATYSPNEAYQAAVNEAVQCNCEDNANIDRDCNQEQEQLVLTLAKQIWEPTKLLSENTLATIQEVVNDLASKQGERVLVVASAGFLAGTIADQVDAIMDQALRQEIVINALDAKGLYAEDPSHTPLNEVRDTQGPLEFKHVNESFSWELMAADGPMADFADGTGGRFFHDRNDLNAGFYSLAAAPETDYLMGFVPENLKINGAFHKLKVEVNGPRKLYAQARPGYFAPSKEAKQTSKAAPDDKIDAEMRGSEERSDFPLSVSEKQATTGNGSPALSVEAHVDIQNLPFEQREDRHANMLTFVAALFGADGKMAAGKEAQMQLALKPETFERFSKTGISGTLSLEAPPGAYRLRVVVQEAARGEISATSQNVQIQQNSE
jgi:VWFA-related protein